MVVACAAGTHAVAVCHQHASLCPAGTVLDNQELRDKLSSAEQKFTTEFFVAMGRHFKSSVLDDLPPAYQSLVSTRPHGPPVSHLFNMVCCLVASLVRPLPLACSGTCMHSCWSHAHTYLALRAAANPHQ